MSVARHDDGFKFQSNTVTHRPSMSVLPGGRTSSLTVTATSKNPNFNRLVFDKEQKPPSTNAREWFAWGLFDFMNSPFFYSSCNFLPMLITGQAEAYAKFLYCGDCTDRQWAVDYGNVGSCSQTAFTTNITCLEQNGTWSATMKKEAMFVPFLGKPPRHHQ